MEKHPTPRMGTNGDVIGPRMLAFIIDSIIMTLLAVALPVIGFAIHDVVGLVLALVAVIAVIVYGLLLEGCTGIHPESI